MAGIYERDNINYPSILAAVAQARAREAERRGDYINQQGQLWGNTAKNLVNTAGRAVVGNMDNGPESWSFAAEGDRSGLDRLRAEELAAENRAKEQEWQWKRMEAEHAHAEKLAKAQREAQKGYDRNKLMQQYKDALSYRDAFRKTMDPNDEMDKASLQKQNNAIKYYEDELGLSGTPVSQTSDGDTIDDLLAKLKAKGWAPDGQKAEDKTSTETDEVAEEPEKKDNPYKTRDSRDKRWGELTKKEFTNAVREEMQSIIDNEDRENIKTSRQTDLSERKTKEEKKEEANIKRFNKLKNRPKDPNTGEPLLFGEDKKWYEENKKKYGGK